MKKFVTMLLSSVFAVTLVGAIAFLGEGAQTEQNAVAETVGYTSPTSATAATFGVSENPDAAGTHDQYIWDASEANKLYSFTPTYIVSKQTTWTDTKTNAFVAIYLASDVNFATSNIAWSNNAGYIYYGNSYDATDLSVSRTSDNPGGGYALTNRGGAGWIAYVTNVKNASQANINPKKLVFKKGFAVAMNDGSVYALAEDYTLYNINGAYLPAKTTDAFLTNAQSMGLSVTTTEVNVTDVSYSDSQLFLTTDTNMNSTYGHYSVNSEAISLNCNNVSSWNGYVDSNNTKRLQYNNVTMALAEDDEFVVEKGFTSLWGVDSTTIYAVKTKSEFRVPYVNGKFMTQNTRDWYVWNAEQNDSYYEVTPKAIASVQASVNASTLKNGGGVSIFIDTDKNLATSNIAWDNNAGYIYYGDSYDDTTLSASTNGNGAQATGYAFPDNGGVGKAVYIMNVKESSYNASTPAKVVLKKGFMIALKDGSVFALANDYALYNVNGSYLPATSLADLQALYATTQVDSVTIDYVTYQNSVFTFGTNTNLFNPDSNPCGTFGDLTLNGTALDTWSGYVIADSRQFVLSKDTALQANDTLQLSNFSTVFYAAAQNKFYVVKAENTAFRYMADNSFAGRLTVTKTVGGVAETTKVLPGDSYALGTQSNDGKLFIGWKVNGVLKAANTSVVVNEDLTVVPQWIDYALQKGAYIRLQTSADTSGIRFVADLDQDSYNENAAYIQKIGIIMMPEDMLETGKEFTLANYTGSEASASALDFSLASDAFTFTADGKLSLGATVQKMRQENFNKDVMARAYVVVNYGGEDVYLYADMNEENVRSIYTLAKAALTTGGLSAEQEEIAQGYVDYVEQDNQ